MNHELFATTRTPHTWGACCLHREIKIARWKSPWVYLLERLGPELAERYLNGVSFSCDQEYPVCLCGMPVSAEAPSLIGDLNDVLFDPHTCLLHLRILSLLISGLS